MTKKLDPALKSLMVLDRAAINNDCKKCYGWEWAKMPEHGGQKGESSEI